METVKMFMHLLGILLLIFAVVSFHLGRKEHSYGTWANYCATLSLIILVLIK